MSAATTRALDLIASCYRLDVDESDWLADLVKTAGPLLDRGLGVCAYTFDARDPARFRMLDACLPVWLEPAALGAYLASAPAGFVERAWLGTLGGYASTVEGFEELAPGLAAFGGARDVLAANGRDPSGLGVWLGALSPRRGREAPLVTDRLEKIAAHLATAFRVRRMLDRNVGLVEQAEAVLAPDGRVAHAEGEARGTAERAALRRATIELDRAKSRAGRKEADRTLSRWKAMVDARWTLLDTFDVDGRRFVVARRNEAVSRRDADTLLTPRERQVVSYAALDHSNKVIAYELGLAAATVRVLLHRASKRIGVSSRADLVAWWKSDTHENGGDA